MAAPTGIGINIGHNATDIQTVTKQVSACQSVGINKFRINMPTYQTEQFNPSYRDDLRNVCLLIKSMGGYVAWGYNAFPLNAGNFAAFKSALRSSAAWMQTNGVDEIIVGNEEDLQSSTIGGSGYSYANLLIQTKDVCQAIKVTDGFSGTVSTAITTNIYSVWAADVANWSTFMKLDLHIYGGLTAAHFDNYATTTVSALGSGNVYCGEFGVDGGRTAFSNDRDWIKEMVRRMRLLEGNGWGSYYYFAYGIGGDPTEELKWSAVRGSGTPQQATPLLYAFGRKRSPIVSTS